MNNILNEDDDVYEDDDAKNYVFFVLMKIIYFFLENFKIWMTIFPRSTDIAAGLGSIVCDLTLYPHTCLSPVTHTHTYHLPINSYHNCLFAYTKSLATEKLLLNRSMCTK